MTRRQASLRRALTLRLALALGVMGTCGATAAYLLGSRYATLAYDRSQADDLMTLAGQVSIRDGALSLDLPVPALQYLLSDEGEQVIYRVTDLGNGHEIASNGDLGGMSASHGSGQPEFRDVDVSGRRFRVASLRYVVDPLDLPVFVELGETTGHRERAADSILGAVVAFLVTLTAVAIGLVWHGVGRELAPLRDIEAEVTRRSASDLAALDPHQVPSEVRGLIVAINQLMQRVAVTLEGQSRFIANAAHQLRTPLAGVRLQAQLGLKTDDTGRMRDTLREVAHGAERASRMVEQLLVLAKVDAASAQPAVHCDLVPVARQVLERFLPLADRLNSDLGLECALDAAWVAGQPLLLEELFGNLIDNALQHGRPGGRVTLALSHDGASYTVSVIDDGPGLPDAVRDKLFQRFVQGDREAGEGSGLGLAIVHEIASRFGADVHYVALSEGSRFDVRLTAHLAIADQAAST